MYMTSKVTVFENRKCGDDSQKGIDPSTLNETNRSLF